MNDKELLELAAKAAGISPAAEQCPDDDGLTVEGGGYWAPLTDDGDALRLAVWVCLPLDITDEETTVHPLNIREPHGDNRYAATRRAIVRAAAEIGRAMR